MTSEPSTQRTTILAVDDTPENLSLIKIALTKDYDVKVATNGRTALKIVNGNPAPDLILLDIMMPEMDGYEVCRNLKANPRTRDIPVIFLTAKAQPEDEEIGLRLGAVDYIIKPFSLAIVSARVKNHLANKAAADYLRNKNAILSQKLQQQTEALEQLQAGVTVEEIDPSQLNHVLAHLSQLLHDRDQQSPLYLAEHQALLEVMFPEAMPMIHEAVCHQDFQRAARHLETAAERWGIYF